MVRGGNEVVVVVVVVTTVVRVVGAKENCPRAVPEGPWLRSSTSFSVISWDRACLRDLGLWIIWDDSGGGTGALESDAESMEICRELAFEVMIERVHVYGRGTESQVCLHKRPLI